jgi:hypothetical protein
LSNSQISHYIKGDEERIVQLLEEVFDGWPKKELKCKPIDHWRWKYLDNPVGFKNIVYMTIDSQIVGCNHAFYKKGKIGENTVLMDLGADSATHKDHRRKGVYRQLSEVTRARRFELGVDIGYWATNNPIFIESATKKNRPKLPYPLTNMVKILKMV